MTTYINPVAIENKSITKDKLSDDLIFDIKGEIPKNEIWYTSNSNIKVSPYDDEVFGAMIVSNTYNNGQGVIVFGAPVTSIGDYAFYDCNDLTSVTIPDSVTSIGNYAFERCTSLISAIIPNSVTSIGGGAFFYCTSLTSVTIPDSVTDIGSTAFERCASLTSVTIPDSVTSIGESAFSDCTSLTGITIPNSVTLIGDYTFFNCESLTSVTIPDSVTSIGDETFFYCKSLTSITIPNSVTSIGYSAFEGCESLTSIIIPDSVVGSIGTFTFNCCYSLKNVTIGKGITSIEFSAFESCDVTNLYIRSENVPHMDGSVFYDGNVSKIYVPINLLDAYKSATNWSDYANIMVGVVFEDDNLISGQNIKTINGKSILGSGDITINIPDSYTKTESDGIFAKKSELVIVEGDAENSAVLKGEYNGYSNEAISQVSTSFGASSTAGLKGWYYTKVNFSTNSIWLSNERDTNKLLGVTLGLKVSTTTSTTPDNTSFVSGWKKDDEVTIVNDKKYERCAKIVGVNGNMITLDKLPFDSETIVTSVTAVEVGGIKYSEPDEFSITAIRIDDNDTLKTRTISSYDKGDVDFGGGAHAEGVQTYAVNIGAHAEGIQTVAYGQYSHTEGFRTEAAYAAHAEGRDAKAMGSSSHAEGRQTQAIGSSSHAEGDGTTASGSQAHSEGQDTTASGNHSHAEGYNTNATSNQAHAEGGSTTASGKQSHAEGWSTTAAGDHSHAEGGYCQALKKQSHAGGNNSIADGTRSFVHGNYAITTKADEVAFGKYNKSESDTLFSIGNGTDENNRSNILEVKNIENDGEVKYEYFAPSGDIIFYHYGDKYENTYEKALTASYFDNRGEYARYKVKYISWDSTNYMITNFVGDSLGHTIDLIQYNDEFLYLPLTQKPQCEIDEAEGEEDYAPLRDHSSRCLYISTDFTEENAIVITNYMDYTINVVSLQYSEHKTNHSALFVNGQRVLVEGSVNGSVNESKDWSDDISNAKEQAISESNTYTDSKIFISRNTSSTGIIDTGCIYKDEEIKNVAKGYCSVAIGAGVLSKSDGAITLGWSDTKTVSTDSTLSTNDDYLNKWKELANVTDETIGSTTQAGFSASLGNNSVSLGRNNLTVGPQSVSIGMRNLSIGNHSVAMGGYNIARGHDSVAMGQGCITNNTGTSASNRGEFACGRFNKSVSDTQFSLGIGTSATKRKNALEIKTNGKHYIYGVGGYDGTNPNNSNDIATVLSNISKDIDGIKPSNMVEIANNTPEVLYIKRNNDQLVVTASDDRLLDYVSVTQGSYDYAKLDLSNAGISLIEKPAIVSTVYCANRADGTTGGTDLTSAVYSLAEFNIKEQELKMQFESYEMISNIQYAKFKIVEAHCVETTPPLNKIENERSWCYLQANTDIMSGYAGTPNRLETIKVKVNDYVYIDKNFIRSRSGLEEESSRNYCGSIEHYYLCGGGDKSNGHLYVKVKGESGDYMMGVNILCGVNYSWGDSTGDFGSDMDVELIDKELGCIYYCVKGFEGDPENPSKPFVIKLNRQFDIIVNDIDSRIIEDQFDIDIMIPFEAKCYKPIKFIDKYVYIPEGLHYKFNFRPLINNTGNGMYQYIYFKPYKKTERGYIADVRDGEFFVPNIFTINSMSDEDIDFKIIEFNPIKINGSTTWCVITNASL